MVKPISKKETYDFTVIIPTLNRAMVLDKCLNSLTCQRYPKESFEIIVADDGSKDTTPSVVEKFIARKTLNLKYLRQGQKGASAARNMAIRAARGKLLLFLNDDTICTPDLMMEHSRSHRCHPGERNAVLGKITISPHVPYSIFTQFHLDSTFQQFEGKTELDWKAFITCNLSLHRSFLLNFGLFDERFRVLHEDIELAERLSHHGLQIVYNSKALGYHDHFIDETAFLNSAKQDGKSLAVWYAKSPQLKKELSDAGLYITLPFYKRLRYYFADLLLNKVTNHIILAMARYFTVKNECISRFLYVKLFQSIKRKKFRKEIRLPPL